MKTLNLISAITILLVALTTTEIKSSTPDFNAGDVIFGGNEIISNNLVKENKFESKILLEFDFEEEAYINDIPFNTECVTATCRYEKAISVVFNLDEEAYVDDIPFYTENIADNRSLEKFDFDDEAYINDIPFNTFVIVIQSDDKNNLTVK